jgi:hypothetical protein
MIVFGSNQWQMIPELDAQEEDYKIIEKRRYDAFHGTLLEEVLKQLNVCKCPQFILKSSNYPSKVDMSALFAGISDSREYTLFRR